MSSPATRTIARFSLAACLALAACGTPQSKEPSVPARSVKKPSPSPAPPAPKPDVPTVRPVERLFGKVVLVNPKLRYVVIDFTGSPLPEAGRRLALYRKGQKIAEIRISGQARYNNISADVMSGEAQSGDEAGEP